MAKQLIKGNTAVAEAALRAGLEGYFGYPITPQTELLEHLSARMPNSADIFQAKARGCDHMVYGAACTGKRVDDLLLQQGVSLMMRAFPTRGNEVPMVLVDVMRGGPARQYCHRPG